MGLFASKPPSAEVPPYVELLYRGRFFFAFFVLLFSILAAHALDQIAKTPFDDEVFNKETFRIIGSFDVVVFPKTTYDFYCSQFGYYQPDYRLPPYYYYPYPPLLDDVPSFCTTGLDSLDRMLMLFSILHGLAYPLWIAVIFSRTRPLAQKAGALICVAIVICEVVALISWNSFTTEASSEFDIFFSLEPGAATGVSIALIPLSVILLSMFTGSLRRATADSSGSSTSPTPSAFTSGTVPMQQRYHPQKDDPEAQHPGMSITMPASFGFSAATSTQAQPSMPAAEPQPSFNPTPSAPPSAPSIPFEPTVAQAPSAPSIPFEPTVAAAEGDFNQRIAL